MKILVLSFYYQPDLCAGSFRTTSFMNEFKNIISEDDSVDIITTKPNRYSSFNEEASSYEKISENISLYRVDLGTHKSGFIDQSKLFFKFIIQVFKIIKEKEKYDLVYATSSRLMTAFLAALISNKHKSKLYLDIRDIFTDTLESVFKNSKLRYIIPIFKQIERYTVNSATHINLVSKGFENYFQKINRNISYSFYTNGIDDVFFNYDFTKKNTSSKKIITYAGNIGEGQGLEKIIPSLANYLGSEYEINIIGDGGRKKALVEKLDNIDNVKLLNPVNREKLLQLYKESDILFLHLNDYDAFKKVLPSKVFEYAITNKFIIAGVGGYAKEFIEKNISDSIVFEPCNIEDLKEKFENYIISDDIKRELFVKEYKRERIMKKMSKEVYSI